MRYKKLTGIILKKQNYKEADQILTLWTKEAGKVRVLAKSVRKPQSRMNYALQDLGLCEIDIVGTNLAVLIGAKPLGKFKTFQQDWQKTVVGFYAAELMLKMTADEHPNEEAFNLLSDFLVNLDHPGYNPFDYGLLDRFCLDFLEIMGFKFPHEKISDHSTIHKFIEYILERNIKSEQLLWMIES